MRDYEVWEVAGGTLEFLNNTHTYVFDGLELPSITQILSKKFGNKYDFVSKEVLESAARKGTEVHEAIEKFEQYGKESDLIELKNWKFLKRMYDFNCIDNEVPVVLFVNNEPVASGRLDLVLEKDGKLGLGDIKRVASFDKEYVTYQLNLYKIAYEQCYDKKIKFLRGVHLRDDKRKYINLPICEDMALDLVKEFMKGD